MFPPGTPQAAVRVAAPCLGGTAASKANGLRRAGLPTVQSADANGQQNSQKQRSFVMPTSSPALSLVPPARERLAKNPVCGGIVALSTSNGNVTACMGGTDGLESDHGCFRGCSSSEWQERMREVLPATCTYATATPNTSVCIIELFITESCQSQERPAGADMGVL